MAEMSMDSIHFDLIGKVKVAGNSSVVQSYDFWDKMVEAGTYYYRLLEVNQEGKEAIVSEVISLRRTADFEIVKIYPIPTNELVNIQYQTTSKEAIEYTVFDITGRLIAQEKVKTMEGDNSIVLDVSNYVTGTYFVKLNSKMYKSIERFVVN